MHVYATTHKFSATVCAAFAAGVQLPVTTVGPKLRGVKEDDVVMYGMLRGCLGLLQQALSQGRNWWYMDNGYAKTGHFDGHYLVALNAFQHDGVSGGYARGYARAKALDLTPNRREWKHGKHILLLPPTEIFAGLMGLDAEAWVENTTWKIKMLTDRPIRLRLKPGSIWKGRTIEEGSSLQEDLKDAHVMVAYNSKAVITAVQNGVRPITTTRAISTGIGSNLLEDIEKVWEQPDVDEWFATIAANQWTLEEMRSGECWRDLQSDLAEGRLNPKLKRDPVVRFFP